MKPIFPVYVPYKNLPKETQVIHDDIMLTMDIAFVPNWFKSQSLNYEVLYGNWHKVKSVLYRGSIPRQFKEKIIYELSLLNNCQYCSFTHGETIKQLKQKIYSSLCNNTADELSSKYSYAKTLLIDIATNSRVANQQEMKKLAEFGFAVEQIIELFSIIDLTRMLNTYADISGIDLDDEMINL